ncbi:RING-H2 finger protein ATL39-like [Phragmites australis]|uniref:RING-H2 finger protein ATL39-like n=1 Tax=Phragmites australis TaxID=29695 RepID=UPI002D7811B8|nr:RING-H2 finger protein ATL39-like [Phragmites australis]
MSSNSTASPGAVTPCCSATMLLAVVAMYVTFSFLVVVAFLFLCFLLQRRRWRQSARLLQEEQPRPNLGLDAAAIALLPSFPYWRPIADAECSTLALVECVVCLNVLDEGQMARQLPGCKHVFHQECIDVWLASRASCPVCRATIDPARGEGRAAASTSAYVVPVETSEDEIMTSSSTRGETDRALWTRPEARSGLV